MNMIEKCGIKVGQVWTSADGVGHKITVIDTTAWAPCDDVVVESRTGSVIRQYRIDAFKLTYRYMLVKP